MMAEQRLWWIAACMRLCSLAQMSATSIHGNSVWCSPQCQCLNNFVTVDCAHRSLQQVPAFSNLTSIIYLDNNALHQLSNDSFTGLANLRALHLNNNSLTSVTSKVFCGLQNLQILDLSGNKLRLLSVEPDGSLESEAMCQAPAVLQLLLSDNQLSNIPRDLAKWAPNLDTLIISFNRLTSALINSDFSRLQALRVLDLRGNRIYQILAEDLIPLQSIALITLSLSENRLQHVEPSAFSGMTQLESLSLSRNSLSQRVLENIFTAIGNTSRLTRLDLREMIIPNMTVSLLGMLSRLTELDLFDSAVTHIEPQLFSHLPDLESLNIAYNQLSDLSNIGASSKMRWLYAHGNNLHGVDLRPLSKLEAVDLSYNNLRQLPAAWIGYKENLQSLNISHNQIGSVHPSSLQGLGLQVLDISYNNITHLDGLGLWDLRKLYLSHNQLAFVSHNTFRSLEATLEDLNLSHNNLSSVPLQGADFVSLQELNMADNSLGDALRRGALAQYFQTMTHLQKLDLSANGVTSVARHQLQYLHHLTTVDFSDNEFYSLRELPLHEVPTLAKLVMSGNHLTAVDVAVVSHMEYLEELDLSYNPFSCLRCDLQPFLHWVNRTSVLVIGYTDSGRYQCDSPPALAGRPLGESADTTQCTAITYTGPRSDLDWAMVGLAVSATAIFLILTTLLVFYTRVCHKLKSLHYRWQIRYREVSGVEFTSEPSV